MIILVYALVTTTLYYLGARAVITRGLWSRYPGWLDRLTLCAACSGLWYGLAVGAWGAWRGVPFAGLPGDRVDTVIAIGLSSAAWTPILARLVVGALTDLEPASEGGDLAPVSQPTSDLLDHAGEG